LWKKHEDDGEGRRNPQKDFVPFAGALYFTGAIFALNLTLAIGKIKSGPQEEHRQSEEIRPVRLKGSGKSQTAGADERKHYGSDAAQRGQQGREH